VAHKLIPGFVEKTLFNVLLEWITKRGLTSSQVAELSLFDCIPPSSGFSFFTRILDINYANFERDIEKMIASALPKQVGRKARQRIKNVKAKKITRKKGNSTLSPFFYFLSLYPPVSWPSVMVFSVKGAGEFSSYKEPATLILKPQSTANLSLPKSNPFQVLMIYLTNTQSNFVRSKILHIALSVLCLLHPRLVIKFNFSTKKMETLFSYSQRGKNNTSPE